MTDELLQEQMETRKFGPFLFDWLILAVMVYREITRDTRYTMCIVGCILVVLSVWLLWGFWTAVLALGILMTYLATTRRL